MPQNSAASSYHQVPHSPHLGPSHGHDPYSMSPGVTHMDPHIAQVILFGSLLNTKKPLNEESIINVS